MEGGPKKNKAKMEMKDGSRKDPVLSQIRLMEREDLLRVLNQSYIAERFFGKSGCWLSQKLNGNIKNGKPCALSAEERTTLADALDTIAIELQDLADCLR